MASAAGSVVMVMTWQAGTAQVGRVFVCGGGGRPGATTSALRLASAAGSKVVL